jgi:uncharacterized protein DUF3313
MKKINSTCWLIAATSFAFIVAGCSSAAPTIQSGPDAELSYDGLHKVDNSQADMAWARPDIDLSGYTKLMPISGGIEYAEADNKGRTTRDRNKGGPFFIDDRSREQFETLVGDVFAEELGKIERFTIVDAAGPDVLMVAGGLLNVMTYVPPETATRSIVFLSAVGEATLVLELRDSESGKILARSIDTRAAETIGDSFTRSNSVTNSTEARRLIQFWARRLVEGLDGFTQKAQP